MTRIMVVDDDPDIVESCTLVLQKAGYEVAAAASREEGLERINDIKPDLLILDVMMVRPDDGITMSRELRSQGFSKPILMLTSLGKVTGMSYGSDESMVPVDEYVEKPLSPVELVDKVADLLKRRGGGRK